MSEILRDGYRRRLSKGILVYFVEGEDILGTRNSPAVVKKGTVASTTGPGGWERHYPFVGVWDTVDGEDPLERGAYTATAKSPRELFTEIEVRRLMNRHEGPLAIDDRSLDKLVADAVANTELVDLLGSATLSRLVDDELRRPGDPEY